ncbi:MAG: four helix bundle protein [Terriglobia bacterium]
MAFYQRFEELPLWRAAKELALRVYRMTDGDKFSRDFGLRDQIRRAAISVSSNIAEGFERGSRKEFIRFLYIAKGSVGEVRSQLAVAEALGYVKRAETGRLREDCLQISRQLAAFMESLRRK